MAKLKELLAWESCSTCGLADRRGGGGSSGGAWGRAGSSRRGASTGRHEAVGAPRRRGTAPLRQGGVALPLPGVAEEITPAAVAGMELDDQSACSTRGWSHSTARRTRAGWEPMPCLAFLSPWPTRRRQARGELYGQRTPVGSGASASLPASRPSRPKPMPMVNMISGGKHAGANLDFQDFLFIPLSARSFQREALDTTACVYHALRELLKKRGMKPTWSATRGVR